MEVMSRTNLTIGGGGDKIAPRAAGSARSQIREDLIRAFLRGDRLVSLSWSRRRLPTPGRGSTA
jgi:hypothetical protein